MSKSPCMISNKTHLLRLINYSHIAQPTCAHIHYYYTHTHTHTHTLTHTLTHAPTHAHTWIHTHTHTHTHTGWHHIHRVHQWGRVHVERSCPLSCHLSGSLWSRVCHVHLLGGWTYPHSWQGEEVRASFRGSKRLGFCECLEHSSMPLHNWWGEKSGVPSRVVLEGKPPPSNGWASASPPPPLPIPQNLQKAEPLKCLTLTTGDGM